uniref:Uncharacterized protein n=1 Tax=Caenorhabditis japonica TaxID=281687 RepID=A0A8R1IEM7_CAEJA
MTDTIEDAILKQEESTQEESQEIDLNDAEQIAALLDDAEEPTDQQSTSCEVLEDVNAAEKNEQKVLTESTAKEISPEATEKVVMEEQMGSEEILMLEDGGAEEVLADIQTDQVEEIRQEIECSSSVEHDEQPEEVLPVEDVDQNQNGTGLASSSSRKRNGSVVPQLLSSPAHKRKRRVQTYLESRQASLKLISCLLGSSEGTLHKKDLHFIRDCFVVNEKLLFRETMEHCQRLKEENELLNQRLTEERRAHELTVRHMRNMEKQFDDLNKMVNKISAMITQPPTPDVESMQFPTFLAQPHRYQFQDRIGHSNLVVHHVPNSQRQPIVIHRRPSGIPMGQMAVNRVHDAPPRLQPMPRALPPPRQQPPPPPQPQPQPQATASFQSIPIPNTNLGHTEATSQSSSPLPLHDLTDQKSNTIMLCVPFILPGNIVVRNAQREALYPARFAMMAPSPNLTVSINSSPADFRDNWQIGGKISYGNLAGLVRKKIQVLVQVSSFKTCGMGGHLPLTAEFINWGCSQQWPCKAKSHKFRIRFHHQQQIPVNDKITVFVVAWEENKPADISRLVSMHL